MSGSFDRRAYLERIGLDEAPPPTLAGLASLQWAQLIAIPFENLDIALGRRIDPTPDAVFAKLVSRKRGGYCHENNGLLLQALTAFGFEARPLAARVMQGPDSPVTGKTHTLCLVTLPEGQFLADAGFGAQTPRLPLQLVDGFEGSRGTLRWRVDHDPDFGWRLSILEKGGWKRLYCFDLNAVHPADIALSNHWSCSHPESLFTQGPLAVKHMEGGRNVLVGGRIGSHRGERVKTQVLADLDSLRKQLEQDFDLTLEAEEAELTQLAQALAASRRREA